MLFAGNDALAREAVDLLEELARKGRSYGIHLVLASQSMTGIEALYGRAESIFGQFPLRVALPGGGGVLDQLNDAAGGPADRLRRGQHRRRRWSAPTPCCASPTRTPPRRTSPRCATSCGRPARRARGPPAVFKGYEAAHVEDDPHLRRPAPRWSAPEALVGRAVDVHGTTGTVPAGRHPRPAPRRGRAPHRPARTCCTPRRSAWPASTRPATPGSALASPGRRRRPGRRRHRRRCCGPPATRCTALDAAGLRDRIAASGRRARPAANYLVVFGMDAASAASSAPPTPSTFRTGLDDLRTVLRQGPAHGVHLLGWWRGLRRLADDLGGTQNRDDVACLVALNVPGAELALHLGVHDLAYTPRPEPGAADRPARPADPADRPVRRRRARPGRGAVTVSFEEYAALARQLSDQHRAGEQHAAAESARRRDLHAAVDYLQQRLTAQGQRLDQLGRAIGIDQPPAAPRPWPGRRLGRDRRLARPAARRRGRPPLPAPARPSLPALPPRPEPGTGDPPAQPARRGGRGSGRTPSCRRGRRGWRCRRR